MRAQAMISSILPLLAGDSDMIDEGLRFRALPPNYVAWLLIPLGALLVGWLAYRRSAGVPRPARIFLGLMRAALIFGVCLLIFDPYRQFGKIEEIRSLITVLVDESGSMAKKENYEQDPGRIEALKKAARIEPGKRLDEFSRTDLLKRALGKEGLRLIERAKEKHDVKIFGYSGGKPRPIGALEDAASDGPITATGDALTATLADPDIQAKPQTSIVLISDGRTNAGASDIDAARAAGANDKIPVHTVGIGDPAAQRDLELRFVRADEVALKGNTVKMALTIRNHGYEAQSVSISITDQQKQPWMPVRREKIAKTDADQVIEVEFTADRVGQFSLDVTVGGPAGEEDVKNNTKRHNLVVKDERLRVLYVDTYPRWEYRRLKNFLCRGGDSFAAQCLLLSAEPDFIQETTQTSDPARRLPPLRRFPTEFQELDQYDVLIFGDVDPQLLCPDPSKLQQTLKNIQKFVDNGGGFVVISGENWTPHVYGDSPLEELLPVDISNGGDVGFTANYVDEWKFRLTAEGRQNPIMQIEANPEKNRRTWEEPHSGLMEMRWWYPARKAMPSAQVLAFHPDQRNQFGNYPLIVSGTYGDGPVLFMGVDETWRWTYQVGPVWFNRFWGNVVRQTARAHLYRGSKRYKLVSSASVYQQGETVKLTAFAKDKNFEDATNPTQRVMIVEPASRGRPVEFEKTDKGIYGYSFKPAKFGIYEAWVVGDEGVSGERYAPITFEVKYVDPELSNAATDEDALKEIARASNGAYFRLEEADKLFDRLRADTMKKKKTNPVPLRRSPWIPAGILLALTVEWLMRKRYRLA